jgi:pimeloyl-ACP methyl ester carboxylesterase
MTPEGFGYISDRGLQVKEETWANRDGTQARGWLLRGAEGAPAVVMLHRYGADRSWLLNLGVKINESANFTILWPDLRGHGQEPLVQSTTFGASEADDVSAALEFLRGLKTPQGRPLVAERFGLYGVELGAYAGLIASHDERQVQALVLDSVPTSADDMVGDVFKERVGMDNGLIRLLAKCGARLYFIGSYPNRSACTVAEAVGGRRVLLLSGDDAGRLRASTESLAKCFPNPADVELRPDLPLTGIALASATGQQSESYARLVIDFFNRTLPATP